MTSRKRFATATLPGALLAIAFGMAAGALPVGSAAAAAPGELEQRLHEEVQSVLLRLVESGEISAGELAAMSVSAGPTRRAEFGAIVDLRSGEAGGVPVLAVTPGGNAARLGLRAGDRIVAVDGEPLSADGAEGAALLQQRLDQGEDRLALTVRRDGAERVLSGPVRAHTLPGYRLELGAALASASLAATDGGSGCGRISVFDAAPRRQHIYPAVLIAIDGRAPKPTSGPAYRLEPGRHVLTVAERIDPEQFGDLQMLQRSRRTDGGYKELVLDVEPGVTYRLGARFVLERRQFIRDNSYWEPVIWAEAAEPCR